VDAERSGREYASIYASVRPSLAQELRKRGTSQGRVGKYRGPSLSCGISSITAVWVIPAIGGNIVVQFLAAEEELLVCWSGAEV